MNHAALIGIDVGKHRFHLHAQDGSGRELFRKKATRPYLIRLLAQQPPCTVAMEACAGAHCLAREIQALGHAVKLISPQFVRPFVRGNKNEAQQTQSVLHRMRESLIRDRTKTINQMHGFLLEFGISLPRSMAVIRRLSSVLAEHELPARLVVRLQRLHAHFGYLDEQIKSLDKEIASQVEEDDLGKRLLSMPCVGPITSSVLVAELGDGK
jgi:transposase